MNHELLDVVAAILREQLGLSYYIGVTSTHYVDVHYGGAIIGWVSIEDGYVYGTQSREGCFKVALADPDCFRYLCELIISWAQQHDALQRIRSLLPG